MTPPTAATQLSRRAVLKAAPAVAALPISVAFASLSLARESAELVAAGKAVADAEVRFDVARRAYQSTVAEWSPQWPLAPDACVQKDWMGMRWGDEIERDLLGRAVDRPDAKFGRPKLCTVKELKEWAESFRVALSKDDRRKAKASRATRDSWRDEIERRELGAKLLPGYQAECARIKAASNIDGVKAERREASRAIYQAVWAVLALPHTTAAGLQIKAASVATLGRMPDRDRLWSDLEDAGQDLPSMAAVLAEAVLQPLEEEAL